MDGQGSIEFSGLLANDFSRGTCVFFIPALSLLGNMTYALYSDSYCKRESNYSSVDKYLSSSSGSSWDSIFVQWNSLMTAYKVCQPCRAYSRSYNYQYSWQGHRHLVEYNDGEGDDEMSGFNCYDDAGYRKYVCSTKETLDAPPSSHPLVL